MLSKTRLKSMAAAAALILGAALAGAAPAREPTAGSDYDLVIRNGKVLDGAGNPWVLADVAVKGGRIARIGHVAGRGAREIDAHGRFVSPGFIDMMDQSGDAMRTPGAGENKIRMGVTTIIAGEGGIAAEGSAPPPLDFAAYFAGLEKQGIALNFGTSISVAVPRLVVMGDKATPADADQIKKMQAIVESAMKAGAFGVTSALIYPPMSYMGTEEVAALAKPSGDCGGFYSTHMRDESADLVKAIGEAIHIGEESGAKVEIYHLKAAYAPHWGRDMPLALKAIADARGRGVDVAANLYPYPAGGTGLSITVPNWVWADGEAKGLERLRDPKVRERLKKEVLAGSQPGWSNLVEASGGWDHVMLANAFKSKWNSYRGRMIGDIAKEVGRDPADVAWDIVLDALPDRALALYFMMDERDIEAALKAPFTSIGTDAASTLRFGDFDAIALPHPRSYGSFPRILATYVRDRHVLSLEEAVRKMTSWPATRMGLNDRGVLREGLKADIIVFDLDKVKEGATWQNPTGSPAGIDYVFVNGKATLDEGRFVDAKAGEVLRHACVRPG